MTIGDAWTASSSIHEDHEPRDLGRCYGLVHSNHDCPNRAAHDLRGYGGASSLLLCCTCFQHVSAHERRSDFNTACPCLRGECPGDCPGDLELPAIDVPVVRRTGPPRLPVTAKPRLHALPTYDNDVWRRRLLAGDLPPGTYYVGHTIRTHRPGRRRRR